MLLPSPRVRGKILSLTESAGARHTHFFLRYLQRHSPRSFSLSRRRLQVWQSTRHLNSAHALLQWLQKLDRSVCERLLQLSVALVLKVSLDVVWRTPGQ